MKPANLATVVLAALLTLTTATAALAEMTGSQRTEARPDASDSKGRKGFDVGINKKGGGSVQAGQSASFTLAPYNADPSTVDATTGIVVTDTLPVNFAPPVSAGGQGWNCPPANGLTVTCYYVGGTVGPST